MVDEKVLKRKEAMRAHFLNPLTEEEWKDVMHAYRNTPIINHKALDELVEYITSGRWIGPSEQKEKDLNKIKELSKCQKEN